MEINEIEQKIMAGEITIHQVFTLMSQHIDADRKNTLEAENIKKLYEYELRERINIFTATLRTMNNGEWDKLKEIEPGLHACIKKAVNR